MKSEIDVHIIAYSMLVLKNGKFKTLFILSCHFIPSLKIVVQIKMERTRNYNTLIKIFLNLKLVPPTKTYSLIILILYKYI